MDMCFVRQHDQKHNVKNNQKAGIEIVNPSTSEFRIATLNSKTFKLRHLALNLNFKTLNPKFQFLNPVNHQFQTLNPKFEFLNPKPRICIPKP